MFRHVFAYHYNAGNGGTWILHQGSHVDVRRKRDDVSSHEPAQSHQRFTGEMNEDYERMKATSEKFADTIIRAFKLRFPTHTVDSKAIIINSLLITTMSFIKSFDRQEERIGAIEAIIQAWINFADEIEGSN